MSIAENIRSFKEQIPSNVTLIAVSKTRPVEDILEAYEAGHRDFGENRVQEILAKKDLLPKDIRWHLIGHLQSNKVKYIADFIHLIHSIDSLKLLEEVNRQAEKVGRVIPVLLQVYIAMEETKFGLDPDEVRSLCMEAHSRNMQNIRIEGLMGMATLTDDEQVISSEFAVLKSLFEELRENYPQFHILSMGMSGDYQLAIAEGATHIRVGGAIFGKRTYEKQ